MKESSSGDITKITDLQKRILEFLARYPTELFKSKELFRRLGIRDEKQYQLFKHELRLLQDRHAIQRVRGKQFGHVHTLEFVSGRLRITQRGTGMVERSGSDIDIFISRDKLGDAQDGDIVEVSLNPQGTKQRDQDARRQGEIVRIVNRPRQIQIGILEHVRKYFLVVPDNKKSAREILIEKKFLNGAREGDKVVVEIIKPAGEHFNAEGHILEVLGKSGEFSTEMQSVVREYNLPHSFPKEVLSESQTAPAIISHEEFRSRLDLRNLVCFTIDPEDAKDFDDALSIELLPDSNYKLGVHIADVSYYVQEGSGIDKEAFHRGTSVYFPNGVIPMLPERLSNNLCSLRPNEDRLTFSVLMVVSPRGAVKEYEIRETIINSKYRFSYEETQNILNAMKSKAKVDVVYKPFIDCLAMMSTLSETLTKKRLQEGSIDFDTAEAKFRFDQFGKPTSITKKVRLESHRLVEEFMLLANRVVARHIGFSKKEEHEKPFIYRVHDSPDPERIRELAVFVQKFGFKLNVDSGVTSKSLQRLLNEVKGTDVENVINEVVLRSMAKAIYSERNIGHYGLAFDYYAHFTSPIRRYPDLIVHRMLKQYRNGISQKEREEFRKRLPVIAKQSSERERLSMEAERTATKIVQVEFMKQHLGDEFKAVISGVVQYGLFIEINDILVEGMIHVRDLEDDYYTYDEKQYALIGRRTRKIYRLGDSISVKVARVNPEHRQIDFVLIDTEVQ